VRYDACAQGGAAVESGALGQFYARKVGETSREIQRLERERRRLVGVEDHAFINLELLHAADEEAELQRRAENVEASALAQRERLLELTVQILQLRDRLQYYRQLEALHAEGLLRDTSSF
jgi:phage-related minor tail protein